MWRLFKEGGKKDASVFEEFQVLHTIPGFRFAHRNGGLFAESVVALELHHKGYTCFRTCSLFRRRRGKLPEVYEPVEARLARASLPMPREFGTRIQPTPRNPDLTGCLDRKWRFYEVKRGPDEQPSEGQLVALAVLRELLIAKVEVEVEVVRVLEQRDAEAGDRRSHYRCSYTLT
jgi:hypothetical protein